MGASERLQVRVNDELALDAGDCEEVTRVHGQERLIRPPRTTLFNQVLAYLREKPDPPKRPSGSMVGREGIAAAAVTTLEQPPRPWPEQVLPYGLAELMMTTPSRWTLTEVSREVRLPTNGESGAALP